jgi:hypothetical protein
MRILYSIYLEIIALAQLPEEDADTLTLGELMSSFLDRRPAEADLDILRTAFDQTLYAQQPLDEGAFPQVAAALDRVAKALRETADRAAGPPLTSPRDRGTYLAR